MTEEEKLEKAKTEALENVKKTAEEAAKSVAEKSAKEVGEKLAEITKQLSASTKAEDVEELKKSFQTQIDAISAEVKKTGSDESL